MMLSLTCSRGRTLQATPGARARQVSCPACNRPVVVPPVGILANGGTPLQLPLPVMQTLVASPPTPAIVPPRSAGTTRWPWLLAGAAMLLIGLSIGLVLNAIKQKEPAGKTSQGEKDPVDAPPKDPDSR